MAQLRRDAQHAAAAMAIPPGAAAGAGMVGPPVAVAPVVAAQAAQDEVWVRIESAAGEPRGSEVAVDGSEIVHGDLALKTTGGVTYALRRMRRSDIAKFKGQEAVGDARLLAVTFQDIDRTERQWRDVSREIKGEEFKDWSLPGPRTTEWCVRFLNRRNGGPTDHHRWWVQNHSLKPDSWGVAEHEHLMKAVDKLGRFDGLDLANLAGVEMMFRRLQLIEYVYSERGPGGGKGHPKREKGGDKFSAMQNYEATIFAGGHKEFGDCMVAPALLEYVAKEVESEAAVLKQVRKAREERASAQK